MLDEDRIDGIINSLAEFIELAKTNKNSIIVDYKKLNLELKNELKNNPEIFLGCLNVVLQKKKISLFPILINIPEEYEVKIPDLSKQHLKKLIKISGNIEKRTVIQTRIIEAIYECPSCGNIYTIKELEEKKKVPYRCSCGRKGQFRLLQNNYNDSFDLFLTDTGGGETYSLKVKMGENFLIPEYKEKLKKGTKIVVIGYLIAVPKKLPRGGESTEVEKILIANNIEVN